MVLRIIPFTGKPAFIDHGVNFILGFTSHGFAIEEKRKRAFFNCLFVLYSNANSVLSKEITGYNSILQFVMRKDKVKAISYKNRQYISTLTFVEIIEYGSKNGCSKFNYHDRNCIAQRYECIWKPDGWPA